MEFGRVPIQQLNVIDFTLPPDPVFTTATLKNSQAKPLQVYVGCSSWGQKVWKGVIFPSKTKDADFLSEYVKHFNMIELNATHYRMHGTATINTWREKAAANPDFKFCPKFYKQITHIRRLKSADELTTEFYENMLAFEDKLGPIFLQVSENFTPNSLPELSLYLQSLPRDVPVFLELRHKDWFAIEANREAVFELMHRLCIGAIITDTAGRRDVIHMMLPTPHAFIRFVGNALHPTDYIRIDEWIDRITRWAGEGLQSVYFGMHQSDERAAPILCDYLIKGLNAKLGLHLKPPGLIGTTGSLF